ALRVLTQTSPLTPAVRGDALQLPVRDRAVGCVYATHIYGLLEADDRRALVDEARRVAPELVVLDAGRPEGVPPEHWQDRTLPDGSRWRIHRRHFAGADLAAELGGEVVYAGPFYVLVIA
ncbi:MAG TPA: class I SAM-dependent methyltransferase, partial [Acidimicrobiales bacterium]|nr:class I SAM-dependent methyltransferase [Acidimicrobiales bacterium]